METLEIMNNKLKAYKGKRVLLTGHTGFKGTWLSVWLNSLGAEIIGYALDPATSPNIYDLSGISSKITDIRGDICDKSKIQAVFDKYKPEIVFHLAAQPLVIESYSNPVYTHETNFLGTVNILEAFRKSEASRTGIFITTDKVYENKEWVWGYRENDPKGGYDPYSASKAAAEIAISSYRQSFFNPEKFQEHQKSISAVRAGNVIGGGDWAPNRLVPDFIRAIDKKEIIKIRNPFAKRPWQHVIEPLAGYLLLGAEMINNPIKFGSDWNFGPGYQNTVSVKTLIEKLILEYGQGEWLDISANEKLHEANLLSLDISKAINQLGWTPILDFRETIMLTAQWYKKYKMTSDINSLCLEQINYYIEKWKLLS
jgi:CDP-glucose 4,6-dehydratase